MSTTTRATRRDRLAPSDVTELGHATGWRFVEYGDREFVMDPQPMAPEDIARPVRPDEIRVLTPRERSDFGTVTTWTETVRGTRVPNGSYAAAVARDARPSKLGPKPPAPVDLVARMPALAGRPPLVLSGPASSGRASAGDLDREVAGVAHFSGTRVPGAFVEATPPIAGPAAILAYFERQDVALSIAPGGRLLAVSPGGRLTDEHLAVLTRCERLLVGHLTGTPVLCEGRDHPTGTAPEAVTVAAVDVPLCGPCSRGEEAATTPEPEAPRRSRLGRFVKAEPTA